MSSRNSLFTVVAALAALGCALVIIGCAVESQSQLQLLRVAGTAGLDAYRAHVASHQLSFVGFMVESVTGHCYARGALVQGLGFWLITAAAASAVATVLLTALDWIKQRPGLAH
ncbi:hypothetical protein E2553_45760 [Paraburkholderia dipogonis]|uniref:Lipoprotein n=1 Tax=Paraburkholderia dipogonis TaxID=1211383 RepID=A0A4Y8MHJ0_9BURK|nr:hypothetical protein [Paraburkholderia dipogonis]TFE36936.1 hypothetical protein E2553_45760 [Paraburkholderia dipogonis]